MSLEKCPSSVDMFSPKRIFVNNADSYHGEYLLKELQKFLDLNNENAVSSRQNSQAMFAEDDIRVPLPVLEPYEIIATTSDPAIKEIPKVSILLPKNDSLGQMLTCGHVVFDISMDPTEVAIGRTYLQLLKDLLDGQKEDSEITGFENRHFILISTVMTWAFTKPLDPETPEMPFVETDFRKRRPHPKYKEHYDLENEVLALARKYKGRVGALVLNIGVTYGGREDVLSYWFQKAWENEPILPILGRGSNAVPLINVRDVATIVYNLLSDFPMKLYILGVEQNVTKQREIIKSIGRKVGTGMFKCIPKEDAFLLPEIEHRVYDYMTLNVNMEPTFIVETMDIQWASENTFAENIPTLIRQFKKERALKPFKIVLHGPPGVGKTTVARRLCETYGLLYISPETVHQDVMDDLAWRVAHHEAGETAAMAGGAAGGSAAGGEAPEEEEPDADEEEDGGAERARQALALLQSGRPLTDEDILGYVRQRMFCHEALNKGWVLDGYPPTLAQCAALYERGEEEDADEEELKEEEEKFEEDTNLYENVTRKLLPDIVASFEATDDFICEKMMRQPEDVVRGTKFEEDTLLKRLAEFRTNNGRDVTPLNFYDELDIHPLVVPVTDHGDYSMNRTYAAVALRMGRPCKYGKLIAAIEAAEKKEREDRESLRVKELKEKEEFEQKLLQERQDKMEYWSELYGAVREEEEAALAAAGEPLRNYLVQHIFPSLTPALLEIARVRPADPVDYLAEHLFKLNPTGRMLEPGYNLQAEAFLNKIELLDRSLQDLDIVVEPLIKPEHRRQEKPDGRGADGRVAPTLHM